MALLMKELTFNELSNVSGGQVYYIDGVPHVDYREYYNIPADQPAPCVMVPLNSYEEGYFSALGDITAALLVTYALIPGIF